MRISKSLLLVGTLLYVAIGSVDCVDGQMIGESFESAQAGQAESTHRGTNQPVAHVAKKNSTIIDFANHQSTTSPTVWSDGVTAGPVTYQSSYQSSYQPSYQPAPALVELGVNDNLHSIINNSPGVVLVDFYADWCGPCRKQSGILHDMQQSASQSQATIIKINIDQHRHLANSYNVSSLPTLMVIKNGQVLERSSGIADHQRVASMLAR